MARTVSKVRTLTLEQRQAKELADLQSRIDANEGLVAELKARAKREKERAEHAVKQAEVARARAAEAGRLALQQEPEAAKRSPWYAAMSYFAACDPPRRRPRFSDWEAGWWAYIPPPFPAICYAPIRKNIPVVVREAEEAIQHAIHLGEVAQKAIDTWTDTKAELAAAEAELRDLKAELAVLNRRPKRVRT